MILLASTEYSGTAFTMIADPLGTNWFAKWKMEPLRIVLRLTFTKIASSMA